MRIAKRFTRFEWDDRKALANQRKHRVSFEEAATVWSDPLALIAPDPVHSVDEEREWILGQSDRQRLLVVVYTTRDNNARIISAKKATRQEIKQYEEEN